MTGEIQPCVPVDGSHLIKYKNKKTKEKRVCTLKGPFAPDTDSSTENVFRDEQ